MTIKVTFEFNDINDAATFLVNNTLVTEAAPQLEGNEMAITAAAEKATPVAKKATKKTTKKATKKEALQQKLDDAKEVTEADCREAIGKVNAATDLKTAHGVLKAYGANKIPDLKPEQRADFIQACQAYYD